MQRRSFVYVITNFNRTVLYIGVTSNLKRRVHEHRLGLIPGFTQKYSVKYLVYYETFESIADAIRREKVLKGKTRRKKEAIIVQANPSWIDLSSSIF